MDDGGVQVADAALDWGVSEATASAWFAGRRSLLKSLQAEMDGVALLSNCGPLASPCWVLSPKDAYTPSNASIMQLRQAAAVHTTMGGNTQDALTALMVAAEPQRYVWGGFPGACFRHPRAAEL